MDFTFGEERRVVEGVDLMEIDPEKVREGVAMMEINEEVSKWKISQLEELIGKTEEVARPSKRKNKEEKEKGQFIFDADAKVLISGMGGVGAQLAKCLVHAGVKSLTLQDVGEVSWCDLSSNPFLNEADLGLNRAAVCAPKLRNLNKQVDINVLTSSLHTPHQLSTFQVVVFTDATFISSEEAQKFDHYCHNHTPPIYFIMVQVSGLFGRLFCDFGPQFSCEIVDTKPLCHHENRSILTIKDDHPRILRMIKTRGYEMANKYVQTRRAHPGECEQCSEKDGFGRLAKSFRFKPLKDALEVENPDGNLIVGLPLGTSTYSKEQTPFVLHFAFKALDKFIQKQGHLPAPDSWKDTHHFCSLALNMTKKALPSIDAVKLWPVLQHFASGSRAVLAPMASVFGGIAAHEVVKALSRVSHPIFQFLYFDSLESLPSMGSGGDSTHPGLPSRYDAQVLMFGHEVQKKLEQAKLLVVGDGVLGCELMKNLALMGVSSGINGELVVTHRVPQRSKRLYVGRQSVFEDSYEGQCVPDFATASAISVNKNLNIHVLNQCLEQDFELVHEDAFWESLDTIIDATNDLRSLSTMSFVSKHFLKPFLFSLISGAQYLSIAELPSHESNHIIQSKYPFLWRAPWKDSHLGWTRSEFERLFVKMPSNVNGFLSERDDFLSKVRLSDDAQSRELLHRIIECLDVEWCQNFQDCINWARMRFQFYFVDIIHIFIKSFEEQNSIKGKHWASIQHLDRRPLPEPLVFSASDADHLNFVKAASILRAKTFGIKWPNNVDWVKEVERVQDLSHERDVKASIASLISRAEELVEKLPLGFQMKPIPFDTDDDCHMEFMTSMFNILIASEIPFKLFEDRAKEVLERFYPPPIASTYTVAAGLTCLKLYKLIGGGTDEPKDLQDVESNLDSPFLLKLAVTEAYKYKTGQNVHAIPKLSSLVERKKRILERAFRRTKMLVPKQEMLERIGT